MMTERLVIVGGGMAAARLLSELVARDYPGRITLIGDEPESCYNRILLSSVLSGEKATADLPLLDPGFFADHGVVVRGGERVTAIDREQEQVITARGKPEAYDRLVLATGARAHVPALPGAGLHGVMGFRNLGDLERIRRRSGLEEPVVVIGGGLLGLEAAHGLQQQGAAVHLVHRRPWLMNRQLDAPAGDVLLRQLQARGLTFSLDASPVAIEGEHGHVEAVRLDNGDLLPARLVLFAAGITPNRELALDAGLDCDRGVLVDSALQTSDEHIFALGECCQVGDMTFGLVAPVWAQAEVLAARLTGDQSARYQHREVPTQLKVSGIDLFSAGTIDDDCDGDGESQVVRDDRNGVYRRLILRDNRISGVVLLGDRRDGNWYQELMAQGADISAFRSNLVFGRAFCMS